LQLNADVITFECASNDGKDLPLFAKHHTDKKIRIGVVSHCNTVVEPAEHVAALIKKALEYIPPERLVITTDCGFVREGLSRRVAYYKCVSLARPPRSPHPRRRPQAVFRQSREAEVSS
jgi:5-methyltetrahydropteroyltriglutamate--homocysteine methyltransferase